MSTVLTRQAFNQTARCAGRKFLVKSSRALARGALLTPELLQLLNSFA